MRVSESFLCPSSSFFLLYSQYNRADQRSHTFVLSLCEVLTLHMLFCVPYLPVAVIGPPTAAQISTLMLLVLYNICDNLLCRLVADIWKNELQKSNHVMAQVNLSYIVTTASDWAGGLVLCYWCLLECQDSWDSCCHRGHMAVGGRTVFLSVNY